MPRQPATSNVAKRAQTGLRSVQKLAHVWGAVNTVPTGTVRQIHARAVPYGKRELTSFLAVRLNAVRNWHATSSPSEARPSSSNGVAHGANDGAPITILGVSGRLRLLRTPREPLISCGFLTSDDGTRPSGGKSSSPTPLSSLRPRRYRVFAHTVPRRIPNCFAMAFTLTPRSRAVRIPSTSLSVSRVRGRLLGSTDAAIRSSSTSPASSASSRIP